MPNKPKPVNTYARVSELNTGYALYGNEYDVRHGDHEHYWFPKTTTKGKLLAEFKALCERVEERGHGGDVYLRKMPDWNPPLRHKSIEGEEEFE